MIGKQRLSATVDSDALEAAQSAAARGEVASVSAWINDALRLKIEHDRRLRALGAFVAAYEAAHGEITEDEIAAAVRRAGGRATVVRGRRASAGSRASRRVKRPRGRA